MKYIMTKDGKAYETVNKSDFGYVVSWPTPAYRMNIYSNEIEKEADKIEELCNALVVAGEYDGKEFHKYFPTESWGFDDLKKRYREYGVRIYGAIWTYKGLIYIAKMNEKGEFELL